MKPHIKIEKISSSGKLTVYDKHNNRTEPKENLNHVDASRTYLNHDLVNRNRVPLARLVNDRIEEVSLKAGHNIRKRKDAVIAYSIILSFTHMDLCPEEECQFTIPQWEQATLSWLQTTFGKENVVSAMVHMDESSPHIHAIVVPITPDNRLCAREYTGGRAAIGGLQRSYAKAMQEPPFNMKETRQSMKPKGNTIKQFYKQAVEAEEFSEEIPVKDKEESLDDYLLRVTDYCKQSELRRIAEHKHHREKMKDYVDKLYTIRREIYPQRNLQFYLEFMYGKEKAKEEIDRLFLLEQCPREWLERVFAEAEQMRGTLPPVVSLVEKDQYPAYQYPTTPLKN